VSDAQKLGGGELLEAVSEHTGKRSAGGGLETVSQASVSVSSPGRFSSLLRG
jgi:hypothetical protein